MSDLDAAYADFSKAVEIYPEYEWAWDQMLDIQLERNEYAAYIQDSQRRDEALGQTDSTEWMIPLALTAGMLGAFLILSAVAVGSIALLLIWHQRKMARSHSAAPPSPPNA